MSAKSYSGAISGARAMTIEQLSSEHRVIRLRLCSSIHNGMIGYLVGFDGICVWNNAESASTAGTAL